MRYYIKRIVPKKWISFYKYEIRKKNSSEFKDVLIKDVFDTIYNTNQWNSSESISGDGSEIEKTKDLVIGLNQLNVNYKIGSILDIPCGDFNWIKNIDLTNITYIGADIVKDLITINNNSFSTEKISFMYADITKDDLPKSDLIFCRDCLVHLSFRDVYRALKKIKKSNSTYLLTTSFVDNQINKDIVTGQWRPINFLKSPFNFSKPLFTIVENSDLKYPDKSVSLWKVKSIRINYLAYRIKSSSLFRIIANKKEITKK